MPHVARDRRDLVLEALVSTMSLALHLVLNFLAFQQCWSTSKIIRSHVSLDEMAESGSNSNAVDLLSSLEAMTSKGKVDPEAIRTIKDLVDGKLLPSLIDNHKVAVDEVANRLKAITDCTHKSTSMDTGVEKTTADEVNVKRQTHRTCRDQEKIQTADTNKKCQFLDFITSKAPPAEGADRKTRLASAQGVLGFCFSRCISAWQAGGNGDRMLKLNQMKSLIRSTHRVCV